MFYSHDIISRKSSLSKIWLAATRYTKFKRGKLNEINISQICENIEFPPAPLSLRLSWILMAGVVIVQNQKMNMLYDDVNRVLDEWNSAFKVKPKQDPTLLPKRRAQAKKQAITLPEVPEDTDLEVRPWPDFSSFHESGYIIVELDKVDVGELLPDGEGDQHQADPADITLPERYDPSKDLFNCERFEIEGDDDDMDDAEMVETQEVEIPSPPRQDQHQVAQAGHAQEPSPPRQDQHQVAQAGHAQEPSPPRQDQHQVAQAGHAQESSPLRQDQRQQPAQQRQGPLRGRRRKRQASIMDNDQTILPAHEYRSWLEDTSDIVSRRRRNPKPKNIMSTVKFCKLMEQPASVLMGGLFKPGTRETCYPSPLLELWKGKPTHDSPSALSSPPEPSSWSPDLPAGGLYGGHGSQQFTNNFVPPELMYELIANRDRMSGDDINLATPENSGDERRSIPSTSSGKGVNKNSSRKRSNDGLEAVSDDNGCHHPDPNFKVSRLSGNGPTLEQEPLMETGPTQTQQPIIDQPVEKKTDAFRTELKSQFETPGDPQVTSLDKLTAGKNRTDAAKLFYQTCVLASVNVVKVEQKAPYGDILITRGPNM